MQRLVLTPQERRVTAFVLIAFLAGATVKGYRHTRFDGKSPIGVSSPNGAAEAGFDSPFPKKGRGPKATK